MTTTPVFDPASPLFPPLASYMKVDLAANSGGSIWILHDKPLPDIVKWADYDVDAGTITLAMETGKIQELGVKVPQTLTVRLQEAIEVSVIFMENRQEADFTLIPLNTIASSNN